MVCTPRPMLIMVGHIGHGTENIMQQTSLGSQALTTSPLGLGCMGMSAFYGGATEEGSVETIRRALDLGITLFDTAEAYGPFENEKLLGRTLGADRDRVTIASKFATDFTDSGEFIGLDGSPEHARRAIDRSLSHLGTDHVDLWYLHRVDPNVPIEDTVGAMSEAVTAGKARYIGVSETSAETLRRAHATFPITAIQSEYSLFERDAEHNGVLDTARELGIGFVPFSPLAAASSAAPSPARTTYPRGTPAGTCRGSPTKRSTRTSASSTPSGASRRRRTSRRRSSRSRGLSTPAPSRSPARRRRPVSRRTSPRPRSRSPPTTSPASKQPLRTESRPGPATPKPPWPATAAKRPPQQNRTVARRLNRRSATETADCRLPASRATMGGRWPS